MIGNRRHAEYALLFGLYSGLLVSLAWIGRSRISSDRSITWLDLAVFGLGTFRLSRLLAYDKVTSWIRWPFVQEGREYPLGHGESRDEPRDTRPFAVVGEIVTNPWSAAMWIGLFANFGLRFAPWLTRPLLTVAAVGGAAQMLDALLEKLQDRAAARQDA